MNLALYFPRPTPPWSVNQKMHWSKSHRLTQEWKRATWAYAHNHRPPTLPLPPCDVRVVIPFDAQRRRDPHNYTSTVVKAIIDGLVQAKYWPDDTYEYVSVSDPTLVVGEQVYVYLTSRTVRRLA